MATGTNASTDFPTVVPQSLVTNNRKVTHLTVWRQAARTNLIAKIDITDSAVVALGQTVTLPASIFTITVPTPTGGTAYAAQEGVRGIIGANGWYVDAHYGDPGNANTANQITEIGQANLPLADWTVT